MSEITREQFLKKSALGVAAVTATAAGAGAMSAAADEASEQQFDHEADVVIVGAGGAGLMACVTAHQAGASVLCFEKAGNTGGDSRLSEMDVLAFWPEHTLRDMGEEDVYENYLNDWKATHEFSSVKGLRGDPAQDEVPFAERFMQTWPEVGSFLEDDLGIEFKPFFSGQSLATLNTFEPRTFRGQANIPDVVTEYIGTLDNCQILVEYEVTTLIQDAEGRVIGIQGLDPEGSTFTARANRGVIIATGSFDANPGMVSKYVSPIYAMCLPGGCLTVTGDGHKMAQAIGAKMVDMDLGLNWYNPPIGTTIPLLIHNW